MLLGVPASSSVAAAAAPALAAPAAGAGAGTTARASAALLACSRALNKKVGHPPAGSGGRR